MKIYPVNSGYFKLDGGAMFGVVPKSIWKKTNVPDENNLCSWALRCMLIEDGDRLYLIDTGTGDKQSDKFFGYYYFHGDDTLEKSFAKYGFTFDDVTDVILTHLHFDHCGGSIKWNNDRTLLEPTFKNATYWSNKDHWQWAAQPNPREKASFLKENIEPIEQSGQLKFLERNGDLLANAFPNIDILFVNGHTEGQMLPVISYKGKKILFTADLFPSTSHIPLPYIMGYDVRPLLTMEEKERILNQAVKEEYVLFFEHDAVNECCTLQTTEKGVRLKETFSFESYFGK